MLGAIKTETRVKTRTKVKTRTQVKTRAKVKTKVKTSEKVLIVLPVYNEELILRKNCLKILKFCQESLENEFEIIIADNNSNDNTLNIGKELDNKHKEITYYYIKNKGKGLAISKAWDKFEADYYTFMDIDLATKLNALPVMLEELKRNQVVIGSRYLKESKCRRSFFRRLISKVYNFIITLLFKVNISDIAIGFKGVRAGVVKKVLPICKNKSWFFDSEFVLISSILNYSLKEIPVIWIEPKGRVSKVGILKIAFEYLKEMIKLRMRSSSLMD